MPSAPRGFSLQHAHRAPALALPLAEHVEPNMKLEPEMVSIRGEEYFSAHENTMEIPGPAAGPENNEARQMLARLRTGGGRKDGQKWRSRFWGQRQLRRNGKGAESCSGLQVFPTCWEAAVSVHVVEKQQGAGDEPSRIGSRGHPQVPQSVRGETTWAPNANSPLFLKNLSYC